MTKIYCKDLTMRLGKAVTRGRLQGIRIDDEPKFKLCTPDFKPVKQIWVDDDGNLYHSKNELERAVAGPNGTLVPVPKDEVSAAKESKMTLNFLDLTVHDAAEVNEYLFPAASQAYRFTPGWTVDKKTANSPANIKWHDFINVILRDANVAIIGKMNLQHYEGLFRLGLYQGGIYVQKQLYPESLQRFDYSTPSLSEAIQEQAKATASKLVQGFDPEDYDNEIKRRLEMIAFGENPEPAALKDSDFDLLEALKSFA